MNRYNLRGALCFSSFLTILSLCTASSFAVPIFDTFGPLDQATFGGQGIPNDEVAISSQFAFGDDLVTVAMSATQRFSNPALTNDGAGTYFAGFGSNFGGNGESTFEGALWNFNFYMNVEGTNGNTPVLVDYQIDLFYDFDPGFDTPLGSLGSINITNGLLGTDPSLSLNEGSQNLNFAFLANPILGVLSPPAGAFNPNALGEYNFAITVSRSGFPVESVAMDVQVIPEPSTFVLLGSLFVGLATRRVR